MMWVALLTDLARRKGAEGGSWLKMMRENSLKELDAVRMQNPAAEYSAETAEIARTVIGASFDLAVARHKKTDKS